LSLVVASSTAIKIIVTYHWVEGRSAPFAERLRRLNIVVSVDDKRGAMQRMVPGCINDGMSTSRYDSNIFETDTPQMSRQPGSTPAKVAGMLWLVANRGKTYELL
jgi:hypothetical protein